MRGDRGTGLATVLLVMAVLAALALTLASTTTFHLRLANRQSMGEQARNLADSVMAAAIDRLGSQRDFGVAPTSASGVITAQLSPDGPPGRLTFHAPLAEEWHVPVSVNNLENDASVTLADGRSLPPFSCYLAARAEYGGVPRVVETVLTIPVYKYAVATSGNIVSSGRLLVASIDEKTDLSRGLDAIPLDELEPGHLAAQGSEESVLASVAPDARSLITGDVVVGGLVDVGPYTDVKGSVKQNHAPEDLPDLKVTDYDPAGWVGLTQLNQPRLSNPEHPLEPVKLEGPCRRSGNLEIVGDLDLDGGYLYVDGDLAVRGAISGKGSIFCTHDISVGEASSFHTDNVQALVAGGGITISGGPTAADRNNSVFAGILFSHDGMSLSNVTVVGSVVNNSPEVSVMRLDNVALLSDPEVLTFDLGMPGAIPSADIYDTGDTYRYIVPTAPVIESCFDTETDSFRPPSRIPLSVYRGGGPLWNHLDKHVYLGESDTPDGVLQLIAEKEGGFTIFPELNINQIVEDYRENFLAMLTEMDRLYQETRHESMRHGKFTLEPNQFLPFEDRVRVIWSRELPAD